MELYHRPIKEVLTYVAYKAKGKVLELGPGDIPFTKATEFCGHSLEEEKRLSGKYKVCDFSNQMLPYKDKEFDFVYARHVLEDLNNPVNLLKECSRVAKGGFFETPSPYVEIQTGIESEKSKHKGYHHHFSFIWTNGNEINILHKYPIVEHIEYNLDKEFVKDPFTWNNYFMWENNFSIKHWRHEVNFNTIKDYPNLILQGVNQGLQHSIKFKSEVLKHEAI